MQKVILGVIGAPFGVKGWLKLHSYTENNKSIFEYQPWLLKTASGWQEQVFSEWKNHNKGFIIKFPNIDTKEQAALLTQTQIAVDAEQLPELVDEEYYWQQLIGLSVINEQQILLGKVSSLLETGANDCLVVKATINDAYDKQERLIPLIMQQVIKQIDLVNQQIIVDWDAEF